MFISPAYAQIAGGDLGGLGPLLPLVLIFVVFYFLLIRPQQKKAKAHRELLGALRRGDRIVTGGGIVGVITKVDKDGELVVEIADGIKVQVMRGTVADIVHKTEPAESAETDDKDEEEDEETEAKPKAARRKRRTKKEAAS